MAWVVLALVALWALFLRHAFDPGRSFALLMDNEFFVGTVLSSISHSLAHGEYPFRMDTILGGVPLYNFPQLSPLYPFYFTLLPIFETPGEVIHSMHWITLGHLLILEINMYVFVRTLGASRIAALVGAALFTFGTNSLTYASWLNITAPYAWFPLYLAGLVGIFNELSKLRYAIMALVGIVLLTLASPAQPLIHAIAVSGVFVVSHWAAHGLVVGWQRTKYPLLILAIVGLLTFFATAPVIVPAVVEFKNMIRWIGPFPPVVGNERIPFAAFQMDQLSISDLLGVMFRSVGAAVGSPFVGPVALALTFVAATARRRPWTTNALIFIALYSIVSSTGSNLGFAHINYVVPILNKIREPSRFLVLFQFAIAALAAMGIDSLRYAPAHGQPAVSATRRQRLALGSVIAAGIILLAQMAGHGVSSRSWLSLSILVAAAAATYWLNEPSRPRRPDAVALMWASAALAVLAINVSWMPAQVEGSMYNTEGGRSLDKVFDRLGVLDPGREYRVIFDGDIDKQMAAMLASYKGIRTLDAYFNPAPNRQFEELYYHGPRTPNYFQALGAKYLVCRHCAPESLRGFSFVEAIDGLLIYEAPNVSPHSYVSTAADGIYANLGDFEAQIADADLRSGVLYVQQKAENLRAGSKTTSCSSRELRRSTNRIDIAVNCPTEGTLVLNEYFDPAWRATMDGMKLRPVQVNGNQIGVRFPPGSHLVRFHYLPKNFLIALAFGLAGLASVAACLIWMHRVRPRDVSVRTSPT